jgi:hypothetical protein
MADGPAAISLGGPAESLAYTLSGRESLRPQSVYAMVDGSGAASAFVARLSIFDASGELLARTRTDDTAAVGDVGDATFAPF